MQSMLLLHQVFEAQADSHPGNAAVLFGDRRATYADVESWANKLARHLRRAGVTRQSTVAVLLPRSLEVYPSLLAILKAGGAYVPVDPGYPSERVAFILENSKCEVVITTSELSHLASRFRGRVIAIDTDRELIENEAGTRILPYADAQDTDLCYIIYTSGSTGKPKGVEVEHRNAVHLVLTEREIYGISQEDRVCQAASLSFDLSVEEVWMAFAAGAILVPAPPDASHGGPEFADFLKTSRVTVLSCVPTILSTLEDEFPDIRLLILGGEACPNSLVDRWSRPERRLVNTYGPTEATVIATFANLARHKPVTIGKPVPGYYIRLLDDSLKEVPPGEAGEICIGGAGVARGYVGLPEETDSKFILDPHNPSPGSRIYRTGDLGRVLGNGDLEFLGRADGQVKLRGYRIELSEIESVLTKQKGVLAAACTVRKGKSEVESLAAYVVMEDGHELDEREFRAQLRDSLPGYMVPNTVDKLSDLPRLPSGKLDRTSLPPPVVRKNSRRHGGPETDTEKRIAKVWSGVFSPQNVSATDDFFLDLGGHSLLAARTVSDLRTDPKFADVSVADIYEHPTVRSLAAEVDERSSHLLFPAVNRPNHRSSLNPTRTSQERFRVKLIQAAGLYLSFGVRAMEWVTPYLVFFLLILSGHPFLFAAEMAVLSAVLVFPVLLLLTLSVKWAVLGRVRPGRHPLWGGYYLRWWFVQSITSALPLDYLAGTPLLPAVYRLFGARIGRDVHLETNHIKAFDLISIGERTTVDEDASLLGYSVENGELVLGHLTIGRQCFVGTRSVLREGATMEDGSRLEDLSFLPSGSTIPQGETWSGSPARPSSPTDVSLPPPPLRSGSRRALTTLLYGTLVLSLPVLVLLGILPGVLILLSIDGLAQPLLYILAIPLVGASFVFIIMSEFVLLKWALVGRVKPGIYAVDSSFYIRNWVVDQMHSLSLDLVAPLHATVYLAPWYRALGARIGKSVELSTATSTTPDLLELGDESTVADEVSLGTPRTEGGWMVVGSTVLGRRSFVGNSAVIPAGTTLGDRTLCGVLSIPPSGEAESSRPDKTWLGSPPIELPRRQPSAEFTEERTFSPTSKMRIIRGSIESLRVTIPPAGFIVVTSAVVWTTLAGIGMFGFWPALLLVPLVYGSACIAIALALVAAKRVVIGRYQAFEKPLWTAFIWRLELVNAVYEFLVTPLALEPLQGTPFLPAYERLMGSKIGKDVYVHTTGFLEWDLVEIGDRAALNEDCVLQTHLFEDRVLKASNLRVGSGCDIGAYSVVLYDSEMKDGAQLDALSLLMKGERLPAGTTWAGIPARKGGGPIELVETPS
jgi:non-ribosomal peptide synthetase-like protein